MRNLERTGLPGPLLLRLIPPSASRGRGGRNARNETQLRKPLGQISKPDGRPSRVNGPERFNSGAVKTSVRSRPKDRANDACQRGFEGRAHLHYVPHQKEVARQNVTKPRPRTPAARVTAAAPSAGTRSPRLFGDMQCRQSGAWACMRSVRHGSSQGLFFPPLPIESAG